MQVYLVNANKTDVLLLIGAIYYQMGNYEQCIAFNDRCILLDPHMAEAHANLANALQQLGNFDMAVIYYQVLSLPVWVSPSRSCVLIGIRCILGTLPACEDLIACCLYFVAMMVS